MQGGELRIESGNFNPRRRESMEATKHTPGPWTIVEEYDDYADNGYDSGNGYKWNIKGPGTQDKYVQNPAVVNSEANARLIAAAPHMLETLEMVREHLDRSPTAREMADLFNYVYAAIQQAT
jgi:hypothetical protein